MSVKKFSPTLHYNDNDIVDVTSDYINVTLGHIDSSIDMEAASPPSSSILGEATALHHDVVCTSALVVKPGWDAVGNSA
jgi:hypothetical protein